MNSPYKPPTPDELLTQGELPHLPSASLPSPNLTIISQFYHGQIPAFLSPQDEAGQFPQLPQQECGRASPGMGGWVSGHWAAEAQGPRPACLVYVPSFSSKHVSSSSNISCLRPGLALGWTLEKQMRETQMGGHASGQCQQSLWRCVEVLKSTGWAVGQAQGLWLVSPLPLPTREAQTGSSMRLSQLLPLPTAWRHRPL